MLAAAAASAAVFVFREADAVHAIVSDYACVRSTATRDVFIFGFFMLRERAAA